MFRSLLKTGSQAPLQRADTPWVIGPFSPSCSPWFLPPHSAGRRRGTPSPPRSKSGRRPPAFIASPRPGRNRRDRSTGVRDSSETVAWRLECWTMTGQFSRTVPRIGWKIDPGQSCRSWPTGLRAHRLQGLNRYQGGSPGRFQRRNRFRASVDSDVEDSAAFDVTQRSGPFFCGRIFSGVVETGVDRFLEANR